MKNFYSPEKKKAHLGLIVIVSFITSRFCKKKEKSYFCFQLTPFGLVRVVGKATSL